MLDHKKSRVYSSSSRQTNPSLVLLIYLLCFEPAKDTEITLPSSSFETEAKKTSFLEECLDSYVVIAF